MVVWWREGVVMRRCGGEVERRCGGEVEGASGLVGTMDSKCDQTLVSSPLCNHD